jgi:hypothetical protein
MIGWIKNNRDNAVIAAVVASALALIISVVGNVATYYINSASQSRQTHIEEAVRFNQSTDRVFAASREFIEAINGSKNLDTEKEKINDEISSVILESERLRTFYHDNAILERYLNTLQEFKRTVQSTSSAADIGVWVSSFDNMLAARDRLSISVYKSLGIA